MSIKNSDRKYIVIAGNYGADNAGDEAILQVILKQLQVKLPAYTPVVISLHPKKTEATYNVESVYFHENWRKLLALFKSACILLLGGGGLFQDWYPYTWREGVIQNYLRFVILAKLRGAKVVFYAQGLGPLKDWYPTLLVKWGSKLTNSITARDNQSAKLFQNFVGKKIKVIETADPAINLKMSEEPRITEILQKEKISLSNKPVIGINIRPWYHFSSRRWGNSNRASKLQVQLISKLANFIDILKESLSVQILFIPLAYPEDVSFSQKVIEKVKNKNNIRILQKPYTPNEILGIYSKLNLSIGMRLHSLIFSTLAKTPCIGLAYDPKVQTFLKQINLENYCFDINAFDTNNLLKKLKKFS